jgi:predicted dehydrogenase
LISNARKAPRPSLKPLRAKLFLAFNRRFDPNFRALKRKLDAGDVGKLETLHITSHDPSPPPAGYIPVSGGLFKDMAIHDFDMARWMLGEEPSEVFAAGACLVDPEIGRLGDIDTAKTILRTPSGKLCVISNSRRSGYGYDQRIEAFGSGGALRAGNVVESTVEAWTEERRAGRSVPELLPRSLRRVSPRDGALRRHARAGRCAKDWLCRWGRGFGARHRGASFG